VTTTEDDTISRIHRAACRLFRHRGFHGTSVREIADEVGIQGGSLYAHMDSKDDLLWEIVSVAADRFFAALQPIVEGPLGIMQKLRAAVLAHVDVITGDMDAAAVYSVEWRHLSASRREAFTRRRDEYERLFRGLVDEAVRGRFLSVTDVASATLFILSSLNWMFTWYNPEGRMSADEVGRMMANYIFDGLKRRTA
jgi:AcrR family transcriptional regulator